MQPTVPLRYPAISLNSNFMSIGLWRHRSSIDPMAADTFGLSTAAVVAIISTSLSICRISVAIWTPSIIGMFMSVIMIVYRCFLNNWRPSAPFTAESTTIPGYPILSTFRNTSLTSLLSSTYNIDCIFTCLYLGIFSPGAIDRLCSYPTGTERQLSSLFSAPVDCLHDENGPDLPLFDRGATSYPKLTTM